jgi:hypothetical protein
MIIQMATNAAERNARKAKEELDRLSKDEKSSSNEVKRLEKLLEWPAGFLKDRYARIVYLMVGSFLQYHGVQLPPFLLQ